MPPVDFQMKPGNVLRVRVLDADGKPVSRARVFFQAWRGQVDYFEFDHVQATTDANGRWVWTEAPADQVEADISPPNGMSMPRRVMIARDEEYVFTIAGPLVIAGKVVDAETSEPVAKFQAIPGTQFSEPYWFRDDAIDGRVGTYRVIPTRGYETYLVRIEAPGYLPAVSRAIRSDEGEIAIDFALKKGQDLSAVVLTPDGQPAAGARAAIAPPGQNVALDNGMIRDNANVTARTETDEAGRFRMLPQEGVFHLTVTHPSGFARLRSEEGSVPAEIKLTPWARVEGTFRVGARPVAGVTLDLQVTPEPLANEPGRQGLFYASYQATTDAAGRFEFDRVLPGRGRVGRRLIRMVDEGATEVTSSKRETVMTTPGATLQVELGGRGRPVVGQLIPPKDQEGQVVWSFASIGLNPFTPVAPPADPNDPASMQLRMAWQQNIEQIRNSPSFQASCDKTGAFRIDDVPPGDYQLRVNSYEKPGGQLRNYSVTVPAFEGDELEEPLDLGELQLEP
jgi:hypothetical protein